MLQEIRRRLSAPIYGWDCPLLTFIYPCFDCGSTDNLVVETTHISDHGEQRERHPFFGLVELKGKP